jgi:hypothetical protein
MNCRGLGNCKGDIIPLQKSIAINAWKRTRPCCICWNTYGINCDYDKAAPILQNNYEYQIPKFNPYISQNPISLLSTEEIIALSREHSRINNQDAPINYYYVSPEQNKSIQIQNAIRRSEAYLLKLQKEQNKIDLKTAKYSKAYLAQRRKIKNLMLGAVATSALGLFSSNLANNLANEYRNRTTNVENVRKNGNALYVAAPILFTISGTTCIVSLRKLLKLRKLK